jgi:hypothetical protein
MTANLNMKIKSLKIDLIYCFFIVLLPFVFFAHGLNGQKIIAVGDFTGSDLLDMHLPFKYFLHDSYTKNEIPMWSKTLSNGFPILAEGQSGVFYPVNIVLSYFDPVIALNYSIILAFVVAGLGAYFYSLKIPRMTKWGAFLVALSFMFSSFFVARLKHLNMIVVGAYLPWILLCIRMFFLSKKYIWVLALSLIFSLQILAGHPHMFYLCFLIGAWHVLFELLFVPWKKWLYFVFPLLASLVLSVGVTAIQLLPTLELTLLSERTEFTYLTAIAFPLHPFFLASFIYPYFMGNPAVGTYTELIGTYGVWWENVMYFGLVQFFIATTFIAIGFSWFSKKIVTVSNKFEYIRTLPYEKAYLLFLAISVLLFLSLAMATYSVLFLVVYYIVPGMRLFRFPNRLNIFVILGMCMFFGLAVSMYWPIFLRKLTDKKNKYLIILVFVVALVTPIYFFSSSYVTYYDRNTYLKNPEVIKLTKNESEPMRIYSTTQYYEGPYSKLGWIKGRDAISSLQEAIPGNNAIRYGIDSFSDRGWFEGGLSTKEHNTVEESMFKKNRVDLESNINLLSLWNVKYLVTFDNLTDSRLKLRQSTKLDNYFNKHLNVYDNSEVMPRAYFSGSIQTTDNSDKLLELINQSDFAPYRTSYTTSSGYTAESTSIKGSNDFVDFVNYKNTQVEMKVNTDQEKYLIFSDTYYPGWKAYVDGVQTEIIPVYLSQRAIKVPPGTHKVEWKFESDSFMWGARISLISIMVFVVILSYIIYSSKRLNYADKL